MPATESLDWLRDGADWPHRDASRFVVAGGVRWHVQIAGDGPPLLLLHGSGASTHSWRDLLPLLARTHTVIAPDLPGHAFTSTPPAHTLSLPGMMRNGALSAAGARNVRRASLFCSRLHKCLLHHGSGVARSGRGNRRRTLSGRLPD